MKYNNRYIVFDVETGGLTSKTKKALIDIALTEVAMVVVDNESLEILSEDSWLIQKYDDDLIYDKGAEKVSGITPQMLIDEGLPIDEVYSNILNVLKSNKLGRQKPILVVHNSGFDMSFIEPLFQLFKDDLWKHIDSVEDTMVWARKKYIEKPGFKLAQVADYCGLDLVQAHRALPDTVTTAKVWIHFMKCLRGEGSGEVKEVRFREKFKF